MKIAAAEKPVRQRRQSRVTAQLPIHVDGGTGVTRDISASGMFILQATQQKMGSPIDFRVDLNTPGGKLQLCCAGKVVRVEALDGQVGVGVKILKQTIQSQD
jgi:hypothetical protein